jgi:hypothetical protein
LTVLPLAVVMAYADGFWMTSLRGAVGSIDRTQGPFASWARESTISLPLFVLAVLAAITLALRIFGPGRSTWRTVVATMLLVVAAGTLVGIAEVAVSSTYDYMLQSAQLQRMDAIAPMCVTDNCLEVQQARSFGLQVQSVSYGGAILLLTNLVLVGWVVAMRGGRLALTKVRPSEAVTADAMEAPTRNRVDDLTMLLVMGLAGAVVIHLAILPGYLASWPTGVVLLFALAAAELMVAAALVVLPGRRAPLVAAVVVSAAPLALWLLVHTVGLTVGPRFGLPSAIGVSNFAATVLAAGALVVAVILLRKPRWLDRSGRVSEHVRWIGVLAVVSITLIGLAGSGLPGFSDYGISRDQSVPTSSHSHG